MPVTFASPTNDVSGEDHNDYTPSKQSSKEERFRRMMHIHQILVNRVEEIKSQLQDPFAKDCQDRLEKLGGWKGCGILDILEEQNDVPRDKFMLPNSKLQCPVIVLDNVLSPELCQKFITVHENVGFNRAPSLLDTFLSQTDGEDDEFLRKYVYEQAKNTSELVQIESKTFAMYLWEAVRQYLPDQQKYIGNFTSGTYQKCGIIPIFRFMRYQKDQGFKPHKDPQRIYVQNPILDDGNDDDNKDDGIYQTLFTIALYLNDPTEDFQGGKLNFVKLHVNPENGEKSYQSQATVDPAIGRCALFAHDELHEGGGVQSGTKYMCQCDVLYKRVGDI